MNLERVIDRKLQLELIPYGSDSFSTRGFTQAVLRPHYERIMAVIAAAPRDYVIFCGNVFEKLFRGFIVGSTQACRLPKADGTLMAQRSRFSILQLPTNDGPIVAGLAHSWSRRGIPMKAYGEMVKRAYPRTSR